MSVSHWKSYWGMMFFLISATVHAEPKLLTDPVTDNDYLAQGSKNPTLQSLENPAHASETVVDQQAQKVAPSSAFDETWVVVGFALGMGGMIYSARRRNRISRRFTISGLR